MKGEKWGEVKWEEFGSLFIGNGEISVIQKDVLARCFGVAALEKAPLAMLVSHP